MMTVPKNVLTRALAAASTEKTRYYLCGVHVVSTPEKIRVEATDGHIAYFWAQEANETPFPAFDVIIPSDAIKSALKISNKRDPNISLSSEQIGAVRYAQIDGSFPDTSRIWPNATSGERAFFEPHQVVRIMLAMGKKAQKYAVDPYMPDIRENGLSPAVVVDDLGYWLIMPVRGGAREPLDTTDIKDTLYA